MSQNTPHELHEEFPDKTDQIHQLKDTNAHFRKLAEQYHTVNRAIHRAETNMEPISGEAETGLRKQRMALKDEIAAMLG